MENKETLSPIFKSIKAAFLALFVVLGFGLFSCHNSDNREQERESMQDEEMMHDREEVPHNG